MLQSLFRWMMHEYNTNMFNSNMNSVMIYLILILIEAYNENYNISFKKFIFVRFYYIDIQIRTNLIHFLSHNISAIPHCNRKRKYPDNGRTNFTFFHWQSYWNVSYHGSSINHFTKLNMNLTLLIKTSWPCAEKKPKYYFLDNLDKKTFLPSLGVFELRKCIL